MELEALRQAAADVLRELVERSNKRHVQAIPSPPRDSNEEQVLLAYVFRWLWEHSEPDSNGKPVNVRPLMEALVEAYPGPIDGKSRDRRLRPLRGQLSRRLEEHGLISRPFTRSWRWELLAPDGEPLGDFDEVDEVDNALESGASELVAAHALANGRAPLTSVSNGDLPVLGEQLTVTELRLDGDTVRMVVRRSGAAAPVEVTVGWAGT